MSDYEPFVFDHVPDLSELLPKFQGLPGVTYYQVTANHIKKAQNEGMMEVVGAQVYTIIGPTGRVDMRLYCMGKPVRGLAPQSSRRKCLVDKAVEELTGLRCDGMGAVEPEPEPTSEPASVKRGPGRPRKEVHASA